MNAADIQNSPMRRLMRSTPIVTILRVDRLEDAVPFATALVKGGLTTLEVMCRTDCAIPAATAIAKALPEATVGLGTVMDEEQLRACADLGFKFAVSPGLLPRLAESALKLKVPYLPGAITPSEIMQAMDMGLYDLKFFPSDSAGGIAGLNYMAGPFPHVMFCPTGMVTQATRDDFLALPNTPCVGGGWMISYPAVAARDWATITAAARLASTFRPARRKAS